MRHYGTVDELYQSFGAFIQIECDDEGEYYYEDGEPEVKTSKSKLVKDINVELEDVLFYVFKDTPRIVSTNLFQVEENLALGRRYYERDVARDMGMKKLYFNGGEIAQIVCKPHRSITLTNLGEQRSRTYFAQRALIRVASEFFPEVKIKEVE